MQTDSQPPDASPGSAPLGGSLALPPCEGELQTILGTVCFRAAPVARRLHDLKLYDVPRHAEEEQAAAIHWMLNLYFKHGDNWRSVGEKILKNEAPENDKLSHSDPP